MRHWLQTSGASCLRQASLLLATAMLPWPGPLCRAAGPQGGISYQLAPGRVAVLENSRPLLTYVYADERVRRPYFADVHAPDGTQLTRSFPPAAGDPQDHGPLHPGLWLAFGDIDGVDFWRTKGWVDHDRFLEKPQIRAGGLNMTVENIYRRPDRSGEICREQARFRVVDRPLGVLLLWRSSFTSDHAFHFGDQEEMGLGVRLATPLTVTHGGRILDSQGRRNERQVWGKTARWCDYAKESGGRLVGITFMAASTNFAPSWFHVRDYGLIVANPFARAAFTGGPPSSTIVTPDKPLVLTYGVLLHSGAMQATDLATEYRHFLIEAARWTYH